MGVKPCIGFESSTVHHIDRSVRQAGDMLLNSARHPPNEKRPPRSPQAAVSDRRRNQFAIGPPSLRAWATASRAALAIRPESFAIVESWKPILNISAA